MLKNTILVVSLYNILIYKPIKNINIMDNLRIDESINKDLIKAAGWAKFLAIILYIGMGITILFSFIAIVMGIITMTQPYGGGAGAVTIITNIISGVIGSLLAYFPASYAMGYSSKIKDALANDDQQKMQEAFRALGSYFKFYGVMQIVMLALLGLLIIFVIIAGAAMFSATSVM